jgi:hypothetical protein
MANQLRKVSDFTIKVIMIFTTLVSLTFFTWFYEEQSLILSIIGLIFVIAIITKGLVDIFSKE